MQLATALDNQPWVCSVWFAADKDLNIYWFSSTTRRHSGEVLKNKKVAAAIGRNMPRDHFDIYRLIKAKLPINMELVRKKCSDSNVEFSIIKMFNKAQKLKVRWDEDLVPLLAEEASFKEVITALAKHFNLKEEKKRQK